MLVPEDTGALPDDLALAVDDPAAEELRDDVDDAAAADARRGHVPHHGHGGLHGVLVDGAGLDGPVGGPHPAGDVPALEGGPGGAGTAHEELAVAEDQLPVGAQVDEEAHLRAVPDHGHQRPGGDVPAYIAADIGGDDQLGHGVELQADVPGVEVPGPEEAGHEGLHADGVGVEAQEQVVHGGVPGQDHAVDPAGVDAGGAVHGGEHGDDGLLDHRVLEAAASALLTGLDDAVDDVRAVADLPVAAAGLGENFPGLQVHQHTGQGGGAQVQGEARQGRGAVLGEHIPDEDAVLVPGDDALDGKGAVPKDPAQVPQDAVGQDDAALVHPGSGLNGPQEALVVGHGVIQGGLAEGEGQEVQVTAEGDARRLQLGAQILKDGDLLRGGEVRHLHAAPVGAGDIGDLDLRVAHHGGQAGQTPPGGVLLLGDVAVDGGVQGPGGQAHPALAAHAVAGTGGVDGHVGLPGHVQELFSGVGVDGYALAALKAEGDGKHRRFLSRSGFRLCSPQYSQTGPACQGFVNISANSGLQARERRDHRFRRPLRPFLRSWRERRAALLRKRRGLHLVPGKGVGAGVGEGKIGFRGLCGAEVLVGPAVLDLVEGVPEHLVVGLLPVEEEVDGLPHPLVLDLPVQVLVDHLGPLFGGDVAEKVRAQVPGHRHIVGGPGVPGGVDEPGVQPQEHMGLDLPGLHLPGLQVVAVEEADGLGYHLHVAELLGGDVQEEILDPPVPDAEALGQVLHGGLQLAVAAAQLLLEQGRVLGIGPLHAYRVE